MCRPSRAMIASVQRCDSPKVITAPHAPAASAAAASSARDTIVPLAMIATSLPSRSVLRLADGESVRPPAARYSAPEAADPQEHRPSSAAAAFTVPPFHGSDAR